MSFFRNMMPADVIEPESEIEAGTLGKLVIKNKKNISKSGVLIQEDNNEVCYIDYNSIYKSITNNIYMGSDGRIMINGINDIFNMRVNKYITKKYKDIYEDKEIIYIARKVSEMPGDFKRKSTFLRYACARCIFRGDCDKAPMCLHASRDSSIGYDKKKIDYLNKVNFNSLLYFEKVSEEVTNEYERIGVDMHHIPEYNRK